MNVSAMGVANEAMKSAVKGRVSGLSKFDWKKVTRTQRRPSMGPNPVQGVL